MDYLYWKLQTVADEEADFNLFRNKYGKVYDEFGLVKEMRSDLELQELFDKIAYKNPLFSKIYSLSLAYVNEGQVRVKYLTGNEKDLIQSFLNLLNNPFFSAHILVHLDSGILLPYFGVRADKNGIEANHKQLKYKNLRPWDLKCISFRDYFKGAGDYNFSLSEVASIYNLDADYIEYSEEDVYFKAGKLKELKESASSELVLILNCHRKSLGEDVISEVDFSEEVVKEVKEAEEYDPMKDLVLTGDFTPKMKKAIQEKCKGKRLTKADKENLKVIIFNAWLQNDFVAGIQDNKAKKQEKQLEVDKFVEGL